MEKDLITMTRSEQIVRYEREKERTRLALKVSKLLKTLVLICCLSTIAAAQDKVDTVMMRKIRNEEKQNSKLNYLAHQLMEVCGPRLTNSPGFARAVNWTLSEMKSWGLQGRVESWDKDFGRGWQLNKCMSP